MSQPVNTKIRALAIAAMAALAIASTAPALAQMSSQVQFQHGKDHAVLNGTITGHEYQDYVLRARAGQTMAVRLTVSGTNGNGRVKLPKDGEYRIRVYLMGNDKDANKTVGYSVSVSIK